MTSTLEKPPEFQFTFKTFATALYHSATENYTRKNVYKSSQW